MSKMDKFLGYVQSLLMSLGSFFIGKYLNDTAIDQTTWNIWVGAILGLGGLIWSFVDRVVDLEKYQVALRAFFFAVAGVVTALGWIDESMAIGAQGIAIMIATIFYEAISQKKSADVAKGKIAIADLMGVDEKKPQEIKPVAEAKDVKP